MNPDHSRDAGTAQEQKNLEGTCLGTFSESLPVSQANRNLISGTGGSDIQENNDMEAKVHEEELECGDEDFREPFLTLSESSGSPAPSVCEEDDTMETVTDRQEEHEEEKRQRERKTSPSVRLNEGENDGKRQHTEMQEETSRSIPLPDPVMSEMSQPELQVSSVVVSTLILEPYIYIYMYVCIFYYSSSFYKEKWSNLTSDAEEKTLSQEGNSDSLATGLSLNYNEFSFVYVTLRV